MRRAQRWMATTMAGAIPVVASILLLASLGGSTKAAPAHDTWAPTMPVYAPDTAGGRWYCPATERDEAAENPTSTLAECSNLQMLVPLYIYPYWWHPDLYVWDEVATATDQISITAIINPASGPGSCPPNTDYQRGITDLLGGGVTLFGYVDTDYSSIPAISVTDQVNLYHQCFNIDGIFFDRVYGGSCIAERCDYYEALYNYVKSLSAAYEVVCNPGTQTGECYLSRPACDVVVIYEGHSITWPVYQRCTYVATYPPERFAMLVHSTPDTNTMKSHIDLAVARKVGYVYVTDDTDTQDNPYDALPSYWQAEIDYIEPFNVCIVWLPLVLRNY